MAEFGEVRLRGKAEVRASGGSKDELLNAAERMFGQFGFAATSLRSIALAAGQANNFAVQYHFGDKRKLAAAVFARRVGDRERRRVVLLQSIEMSGKTVDSRTLLSALLLPMADPIGTDEAYNYARFLRMLLFTSEYTDLSADANMHAPATRRLASLLEASLPGVPPTVYRDRLGHCTFLFLNLALDLTPEVSPVRFKSQAARTAAALDAALAMLSSPVAADALLGDDANPSGSA